MSGQNASQVQQAASPLAPSKSLTTTQKVLAIGAAAAAVLLVAWTQTLMQHAPAKKAQDQTALTAAAAAFKPPAGEARQPPVPALPMPDMQAALPVMAAAARQATFSAPMAAYTGQLAHPATAASAAANGTPAAADPRPGGAEAAQGALGRALQPTVLKPVSASLLPHQDYLITQGSSIPCQLTKAINTALPSIVTCLTPEPVYGRTGRVQLLDANTKLVGQINSSLGPGQQRAFILWTRAETPEGVIISLDSPGADGLGRGGVDGTVDTHFWQQFGPAMMLTALDGLFNLGTAALSQGNGNTYIGGFLGGGNPGEQVANTALQARLNIPPTLTVNQGAFLTVTVARDLDFSTVYRVRETGR